MESLLILREMEIRAIIIAAVCTETVLIMRCCVLNPPSGEIKRGSEPSFNPLLFFGIIPANTKHPRQFRVSIEFGGGVVYYKLASLQ